MRALAILSLLLGPAASAFAAPGLPATCSAPPLFATGLTDIPVIHVVLGEDGESHFEDSVLPVTEHPFFKSGKVVQQAMLAEGARSSLISGPADMALPMHASPRVLFLELSGSSVVSVASGKERAITPGTIVVFDDQGSKTGHGGRTGPCGYAAISIVWPEPKGVAAATH